ncbi:MAG TPA: hypothetical protein PKA13_08385 [Geminicoccaceae bacterium]|nr:hypothetical protein [Geminicoccus sp.]HMU49780.1 hypothetical protein [Geminicoccaceae bacterium]
MQNILGRCVLLTALTPALLGCLDGGDFGGLGGGSPWGGGGYGRSTYGYGGSSGWGGYRSDDRISCDARTEVCYKNGRLDASETRDRFGKSASREVERIREQQGTGRVYVPRDGSVCNRAEGVCYKNGKPDWSDTRDYIGKNAARRVRAKQAEDND